MAQKGELIIGLDIGSTKIRMVAGQRLVEGATEQKMNIIASSEMQAEGIHRGVITSIEDAQASITKCLDNMEHTVGKSIDSVWIGISGSHIMCQESRGVVAVSRSDGEIADEDVDRAVDAARTVATPSNYEILHVIPKNFTIDGQTNIKDPLGMTGIRLEVDALIIQGLSSHIKNLTKCVYRTGLEINDIVLSILAASSAVLTSRQRELGVAVIDIGGTTTSLIVMEEGDVIHTAVLPVGSDHITQDIAIGLRVSIDAAEKIKLRYGTAVSRDIDKRETIAFDELDIHEEGEIPRKYIAEITEARAEEILKKVDAELERVNRSGMLPAGAVLIGGGAKMSGMVELAKQKLRLPASIGQAQHIISSTEKTNDPSYFTALGLVMWGSHALRQRHEKRMSLPRFHSVVDATDKMKKWFKSLMP